MQQNADMYRQENAGVGALIRAWRQRRRLSQLHLALEAGISQRHLSFVESGRALPSRDMVLTLAESLAVPLRQRNRLLLAAGYAPFFGERTLDDPALKPAIDAVQRVLDGHMPYPALAVDRHWNMLAANAALAHFLQAVEDKALLEPPVNALRVSLHPKGLAPHIANLGEWRAHVLERLRRLNDQVADPALGTLERELAAFPGPAGTAPSGAGAIVVPFRLRLKGNELSFLTTTTVFGAPLDATLSELAIESFFPVDESTGHILRQIQEAESQR